MAHDEWPTAKFNVKNIVLKESGTTPHATTVLSGLPIVSLSGGTLIFTGSAGTITTLAVA